MSLHLPRTQSSLALRRPASKSPCGRAGQASLVTSLSLLSLPVPRPDEFKCVVQQPVTSHRRGWRSVGRQAPPLTSPNGDRVSFLRTGHHRQVAASTHHPLAGEPYAMDAPCRNNHPSSADSAITRSILSRPTTAVLSAASRSIRWIRPRSSHHVGGLSIGDHGRRSCGASCSRRSPVLSMSSQCPMHSAGLFQRSSSPLPPWPGASTTLGSAITR